MSNPSDEISQAEKRRILAEDRRARTYFSQAQASANDDAGGRFAATANKPKVIGASPIAYPAQPEGSPWHSDPLPPEPPLGFSVEDQPTTGEPFEIARSMQASSTAASVDGETPTSSIGGGNVGVKPFRRRI
jgi:hypothetical protein